MNTKIKKITNSVNVIANGAMGTPEFAEGGILPHLILDLRDRPDIEEFIRIHKNFGYGDVSTNWGERLGNSNIIILVVEFTKPIPLAFSIQFHMEEHSGTIDHILQRHAFYMQAGVPGDVLSQNLKRDRIVVEVPSGWFDKKWDSKFFKHTRKRYKNAGLKTRAAEKAAREHIRSWRQLAALRPKS